MPDTEALPEPKMPEPTMTCSRCGEAFNLPWLQPGQTWQHCDGGAMIKAGPSDTEALAERARVVAWLRLSASSGIVEWQEPLNFAAAAIEANQHDYIAIPRLTLGDQKGVG